MLPPAAPCLTDAFGPWAIAPHVGRTLPAMFPKMFAGPAPRAVSTRTDIGGVAVIGLTGVMTKAGSLYGGGTAQVAADVRRAATDPNVTAILLVIDSPGGTVAGTDDLAQGVRSAWARKPVWAHVDDLCASAAYWVASQCGQIWANSSTALVGSIGTYLTLYDQSAAFGKAGVKPLHFATGSLKGAGAPGTVVTDEQRAHFQSIVDTCQVAFNTAVVRGRKLSPAQFAKVRAGGVFAADDARGHRLIDGIRSFDDTLAALRRAK